MGQQVKELRQLVTDGEVAPKDLKFANKLVMVYQIYGALSKKQTPWVAKLIERAICGEPEPEMTNLGGSFQAVIDLLTKAKEHLKWPKIRLTSVSGHRVVLSIAGPTAKVPGSINVTDGRPYDSNIWYGRVHPDGTFEKAMRDDIDAAEAMELLSQLAADPHGAAQLSGKLSGTCCFCGATLTDARSTSAGYGPTCAGHYGLAAQWEEAAGEK